MTKETLVYSSDKGGKVSQKSEKSPKQIREEPVKKPIKPVIHMERSGRGGKTVTIISKLPNNSEFLSETLKVLKQKCGTGGKFYLDAKKGGCVELQGDWRIKLPDLLKSFDWL